MTSPTTPAPYVVTRSSDYSISYLAWKAFDDKNENIYDSWWSNDNESRPWISINLEETIAIKGLSLEASNSGISDRLPKAFVLEGLDELNNWNTIFEASGDEYSNADQKSIHQYMFSKVSYKGYRINIISTYRQDIITDGTAIASIKFYKLIEEMT